MGRSNDYPELPSKERERIRRREKKRQPEMTEDGRGVFTLARIIQEKAKGLRPVTGKRKKRKKRRK